VGTIYITKPGEKPIRRRPRAGASILEIHGFLFLRHGRESLALAVAAYAAVILLLGEGLAISGNYFVALPVIVAALAGGTWAGLAAGALGLPANLALFALIGHPEFSPASKPIAEAFGAIVGFALGYLADYFRELQGEIGKLARTEESLRQALADKELLLKELHHRVKNNLNVIKSLVQLQRNRSGDPAFVAAADELVGRILAISLVHDQLYGLDSPLVRPGPYLEAIAANVASTFSACSLSISVRVEVGERVLPSDTAVPLGLVVNEALTNAMKHAAGEGREAAIALRLEASGKEYLLSVRDSGPGLAPGAEESVAEGLGLRIIHALAAQLGGSARIGTLEGEEGRPAGALLEMRWPIGPGP
jgi:two-component sensor histidine kinase